MKKALICGISGQDGAYLAELLLKNNYAVYGTSRDAQISEFRNLTRLGIRESVQMESMSLNDFRSVLQVLAKVQLQYSLFLLPSLFPLPSSFFPLPSSLFLPFYFFLLPSSFFLLPST